MYKKLLLFDFDETLVRITDLHSLAWKDTIGDIGLSDSIEILLPPERFRIERFDSTQRIIRYFFQRKNNKFILENFFNTSDHEYIANQMLDIKESHLLYLINELNYSEIVYRLAPNFLAVCDMLNKKYDFGIISSTRQSVIYSFLDKANLVDVFKYIVGEEALMYNGRLYDKPSGRALTSVLEQMPKNTICAYIGDDVRIDALFAKNIKTTYIQASAKDDFMNLLPTIEEVT